MLQVLANDQIRISFVNKHFPVVSATFFTMLWQ